MPDGGNPFLALSGLEQPASIVVAYFGSTAAQEEVAGVSDTAEFSVQLDASTRGPVIAIDVTDQTAEGTIETLDFLAARVPEELQRLQNEVGAPAPSIISSMQLVTDDEPEADNSGTVRITIAALAAGIVATGVATFALDGVLMRRRTRRRAKAAAQFGPSTSVDTEAVALDADPAPEAAADYDALVGAEEIIPSDDPAVDDPVGGESPADDPNETADPQQGSSRSARDRVSDPERVSSGSGRAGLDSRAGRNR
ncbi:hypothetical protein [Microbacterium trichothecenolyticum]|uniref:hypothetical protein n=1 Tax=Microbacterium trichothecenolyticum TaxID=69370 RepID=UPI0012ED5CBE|nr:hypothetical protein [Microbacterium trichothecenolyticum]